MQTNNLPIQESDKALHNVRNNKAWLKKLPGLLRSIGTVTILVSLYSFLMRGWEGNSDLIRYLMLLSHTGLLAIVGLMSGHFLKEGKGARLLLVLALIAIPVNFAILGAFIYSATLPVDLAAYPSYVAWSVNSFPTALLITSIAAVVLIPIMIIGFRVLARGMSQRMSFLYIVSNMALLLPLRDSALVAIVAFVLLCYTLLISAQTVRERTEVKTREGMIALLLQFLPLGVLLGRTLWLYSPGVVLYTVISLMIFIALRQCTVFMKESFGLRSVMEALSIPVAITTASFACDALVISGLDISVAMIIATLIAASLIYEISLRSLEINVGTYRIIASTVAAIGLVLNLSINGGIIASLLTVMIGVGVIVLSYLEQQRSVFVSGVVMVVAALFDQLIHVFQFFDFGYWVVLAILGVITIVLASMLESKGRNISQHIHRIKTHYADWSY